MMRANDKARFEVAYQSAVKLMEEEWLQAGMNRAELEQNKRIADSLDTLAACGVALDSGIPESGDAPDPAALSSLQAKVSELEQRVRALEEANADPAALVE